MSFIPRRAFQLTLAGLGITAASSASAQHLGPFTFQLAPYCNVLTVSAVPVPSGFQISGTDDHCGAVSLGTFGTAFVSTAGVGMSLAILGANGQPRWRARAGQLSGWPRASITIR